jgi:hypothetical protein
VSAFSIGQQVICIYRFKKRGFNLPQFMQIYTVRAHCTCSDMPSILLKEIHNRKVKFARTFLIGEASFAESRFAPLEKLIEDADLEAVA